MTDIIKLTFAIPLMLIGIVALVVLLPLILLFFVVVWALGVPIKIKHGSDVVGYLRWTKFTPLRKETK